MTNRVHPLEQSILALLQNSTVLSVMDVSARLAVSYKVADYRLAKMLDSGSVQRVCAVRAGAINTSARHVSLPGAEGVALYEGWTAERLRVLADMHADGMPYAEIARALNVSVGSVAGMLDRTDAPRRPRAKSQPVSLRLKAPKPEPTTRQARDSVKPPKTPQAPFVFGPQASPVPIAPTPVVEREEKAGAATVMTIGPHMCRWPIGDPSSDEFTFCGAKQKRGPYCESHGLIAYQPKQPKPAKRVDDIGGPYRRRAA